MLIAILIMSIISMLFVGAACAVIIWAFAKSPKTDWERLRKLDANILASKYIPAFDKDELKKAYEILERLKLKKSGD